MHSKDDFNKASIIMPAYNSERYIEASIKSVINQTWENWELLIINDGSSDSTESICQTYQEKDPRIKLITTNNAGASSARNIGLKETKGTFITFLDSDDVLTPRSIQIRAEYLINNKTVDGVDGIVSVRDDSLQNEIRSYQPYYYGEWLPRLVALDDRAFLGVCLFFRKSKLGKTIFVERLTHAEDLLFYIDLAKKGFIYSHVKEEVYHYRKHKNSAMNDLDGLLSGYKALIRATKSLNLIFTKKIGIRIKSARVIFACRIKEKNFKKAIKDTVSLLLV